ncbi:hypothetical protein Esti_000682 [Eimeria stiedai]
MWFALSSDSQTDARLAYLRNPFAKKKEDDAFAEGTFEMFQIGKRKSESSVKTWHWRHAYLEATTSKMALNASEISKEVEDTSPSFAGRDSLSLLCGDAPSAARDTYSLTSSDNHAFPVDNFTLKEAQAAGLTLQHTSESKKMEPNLPKSGLTQLKCLEGKLPRNFSASVNPCDEIDGRMDPQRPEGFQTVLVDAIVEEPKLFSRGTTTLPTSQMQGLASSNQGAHMLPKCRDAAPSAKGDLKPSEVEAWIAAVKKQHLQRYADAAAAGFDAASVFAAPQLEDTLGVAFAEALSKQVPFLISELPELKLSVEQVARFVCCLSGQPPTNGGAAPLPELVALFLACE